MKSYTAADLEALAQGRSVSRQVFRAILCDPEAMNELNRMAQVAELRHFKDNNSEPRPDPEPPPVMDVTFDELTRYAEGNLPDLERMIAVQNFLAKHFPEDLARIRARAASADTHMKFNDTAVELGGEKPKQEPPREKGKRA